MTHADPLEQRLQQLGESLAPESTFAEGVMGRLAEGTISARKPALGQRLMRAVLKPRRLLVAACILAIAVVWSMPFGGRPGNGKTSWWLGQSAVYAQEISSNLERARIDGIVARARTIFIMDDGRESTSSTVRTYFIARDRYRLDIYDDAKLREIQWYVPEDDELVQTSYDFRDGSTSVTRHEGTEPATDPITHLVEIVGYIDRADRRFGPKEIDGHECVGFEISADKVDAPGVAGRHRIWFDTKTKLPVLLEFDRPSKVEHMQRMVTAFDRFDWNPRLPADTFTPHPVPDPSLLRQ